MFKKHWVVFAALVAVAALFSLFAPEAFAMGHHAGVVSASAALVSLRAEHVDIVAKIKAKASEIVAGLAPEMVSKIESDHAKMIQTRNRIESDIAAEEKRISDEATAAANGDKPKSWAAAFLASASTSGLSIADINKMVTDSATLEVAKDALITAMGKRDNADLPGPSSTKMGRDATEKFIEGATAGIIAKISMFNDKGKPDPKGQRNEFTGMTLRELARHSLSLRGISIPHDPMTMVSQAFAPVVMGGQLTTGDFSNVLANVAHKALLKGYEEAGETFDVWTSKGTLTDFKIANRVDLGLFPSLKQVQEGAEYQYASISDRGVQLMLATYGRILPISRQAIINDDLNAFSRVPGKMGTAAKRTVGDLVYAILTSNPTMADSVALFHANHKNLFTGAGTALSASALDTARSNMAKQPDPDNIKQGLNIIPAYWIGPVGLLGTAKQLFASQTEPGQTNPGVGNRVQGMATPVADARLDGNSATAWYLAGGQQYDTIEVDYLNGVDQPQMDQRIGFDVDGVEFKVRLDAGVNLLDFRALQKNAGA